MFIIRIIKYIPGILGFILFTLLTQVGGLIWLIFAGCWRWGMPRKKSRWKLPAFIVFYVVITLLVIPPIAQLGGKVPLPLYAVSECKLRPDIWLTPLCNRHYVTPQLKSSVIHVSKHLSRQNSDLVVQYLDANFPFLNGFPMLPHLSHDDGEKLDLAFFYYDPDKNKSVTYTPGWLGYGVYEKPQPGEVDIPKRCRNQGYWQYNMLYDLTPQVKHATYRFDHQWTRKLIVELAEESHIQKIFIEPHLKRRLNLGHLNKLRYHGCHAIRHDDHIHIEK